MLKQLQPSMSIDNEPRGRGLWFIFQNIEIYTVLRTIRLSYKEVISQ